MQIQQYFSVCYAHVFPQKISLLLQSKFSLSVTGTRKRLNAHQVGHKCQPNSNSDGLMEFSGAVAQNWTRSLSTFLVKFFEVKEYFWTPHF